GTKIIGRLNKLGIIIFIAPKAIAIVTPGLLTFHEFTTSTSVVAATPIAAAPAAKPLTWIAIAIATVEIGEIINTAKEQAIKIHIKTGCNSVNVLITLPIAEVIAVTYGYIYNPIKPAPAPTTIGVKTIATDPNLSPINRINPTAIDAVNIVLIISPVPAPT